MYRRLLALLDAAPDAAPLTRRDLLAALHVEVSTLGDGNQNGSSETPAPPDPAASWALLALRVGGLVDQPARGVYALTPTGRQWLLDPLVPARFGLPYLAGRVPAVKAWRQGSAGSPRFSSPEPAPRTNRAARRAAPPPPGFDADADPFAPAPATTPALSDYGPEERLEAAWREHRAALADELLARLRAVSPARFEVLVVELLVRMGYGGARPGAGVVLGGSGDGGVDGVIHEDPLGLEAVYLQAKQQQATVGRPEIQAFVGALEGRRARKGVFLTTGGFTKQAQAYAGGVAARVVLLDGPAIVALMLEHGVGLTANKSFTIHAVDAACFAPVEDQAPPARRFRRDLP